MTDLATAFLLVVGLATVTRADTSVPQQAMRCEKIFDDAQQQIIQKYKVRFEDTVHCGPSRDSACFPSANGMELSVDLSPEGALETTAYGFLGKENGWTYKGITEEGFHRATFERARGPRRIRFRIMIRFNRRDHPSADHWSRIFDVAVRILERAGDRCLKPATKYE
jgi:hypothetical protein